MTLPPRPTGRLRVVIDTDAANEIDDQFAIAWALLAPDLLEVVGIHAAPFCHGHYFRRLTEAARSRGGERTPMEDLASLFTAEQHRDMIERNPPAMGEQRSRHEIHRVLAAMDLDDPPPVVAGSGRFMESPDDLVESDAAHRLVELAADASPIDPLYVVVIGAPTNVAASLLVDPTIAERIVVIFVAGYPSGTPHVDESFNLVQDRHATNVVLAHATHLLYQPGYQVAEVLGYSLADSERWLRGHGRLGDFLHELYVANPIDRNVARPGRAWVMWDILPVAWLLDPAWSPTFETPRAQITPHHTWEAAPGTMTEAYRARRNDIFGDFVTRLHAAE
ncbi:MAG: nucleoside hydrolase [Ilumatobacter sp.]|uniref:nucleoside hydrolase n=1 Tax=Ilumatobacter sp. TaxID=1967498 RepID=UPI00329768D3